MIALGALGVFDVFYKQQYDLIVDRGSCKPGRYSACVCMHPSCAHGSSWTSHECKLLCRRVFGVLFPVIAAVCQYVNALMQKTKRSNSHNTPTHDVKCLNA